TLAAMVNSVHRSLSFTQRTGAAKSMSASRLRRCRSDLLSRQWRSIYRLHLFEFGLPQLQEFGALSWRVMTHLEGAQPRRRRNCSWAWCGGGVLTTADRLGIDGAGANDNNRQHAERCGELHQGPHWAEPQLKQPRTPGPLGLITTTF